MKAPLFSCVVPVKGDRPYMNDALASLRPDVQGIAASDLEVIVQDADVEPDMGQSDAFNKGFAKAKGEWFFWLNADDVLLPGTLVAVKELVERSDVRAEWISGNIQYIDSEGRVIRCAVDRGAKWMYKGLPVRVYGPSSFFRRDLYERCKTEGAGFDVALRYMMDTDLWNRFRRAGAWHKKLPQYCWGFRVHDGSLTSGDLTGHTPEGMEREYALLDERYQTTRGGWRSKMIRIVRMLDGCYLRAYLDTKRFAGHRCAGGGKILHVVPGLNEPWNGIAGAAKDIAAEQGAGCVETRDFALGRVAFDQYDEVWVHSNWWPPTLIACWRVIRAGKPLVRMTHANLDPFRYRSKWWKKAAVSIFERWLYRRTARVVVTCEAERTWCQDWGVKCPIEIYDLRRFYRLDTPIKEPHIDGALHVLFLGRAGDPLKGVRYLERAVADLNELCRRTVPGCSDKDCVELKIVTNTYGDELEKIWQWTQVLCLPTLTENFGRVVAEALERGIPVINTDGAPAWKTHFEQHPDAGYYLKGYREGTDGQRVRLLADAMKYYVG